MRVVLLTFGLQLADAERRRLAVETAAYEIFVVCVLFVDDGDKQPRRQKAGVSSPPLRAATISGRAARKTVIRTSPAASASSRFRAREHERRALNSRRRLFSVLYDFET